MNNTETKINKKNEISDAHYALEELKNITVGRYENVQLIGQGGMAMVYKAYDPMLDRCIAIKLLRKGVTSIEKAEKRFRQEIKHQSKLNIPGCVKIFDCGKFHGQLYCVMEFIEGDSLDKLIKGGQLTLKQKLDILLKISKIIKELHFVKLEHRDVKPANIMVNSSGRVFLLDFGLSKAMDQGINIYNTVYGDFFGTPAYMSPEQADTKMLPLTKKKHRTDIYALGMTAYELLTGHLPFELEHLDHEEISYVIKNGKPKQPRTLNPGIPVKLEELILKSLSKDPSARPTSTEFYNKLKSIIDLNKIKNPKIRVLSLSVAYAVSLIVIIGIIAYGYSLTDKHNVEKPNTLPIKVQATAVEIEKTILPPDLKIIKTPDYPSTAQLAPGSLKAQKKQKNYAEKNSIPIEVIVPKFGIKMRLIPPGTFIKGSPSTEQGRSDNEIQKKIIVKKPFYIGAYEITEKQWKDVMGDDTLSTHNSGPDNPVTDVSWNDCQKFLIRLCKNLDVPENTYRLPTEAEWEYASRAGTATPFYFGKKLNSSIANFDGVYQYGSIDKSVFRGKPTPVGCFSPNAFGLYDTVGNVWEWCSDKYYVKMNSNSANNKIIYTKVYRVTRGGSWLDKGSLCRSSSREEHDQADGSSIRGFRIVRTVFNNI
jgi:eukaryotic-like serine/threonine-protein kinase